MEPGALLLARLNASATSAARAEATEQRQSTDRTIALQRSFIYGLASGLGLFESLPARMNLTRIEPRARETSLPKPTTPQHRQSYAMAPIASGNVAARPCLRSHVAV